MSGGVIESPRELAAKIVDGEDPWTPADAVAVAEAYLAADDLLRRLSEWDMLWLGPGQPSMVADGPYWKAEIDRVRA